MLRLRGYSPTCHLSGTAGLSLSNNASVRDVRELQFTEPAVALPGYLKRRKSVAPVTVAFTRNNIILCDLRSFGSMTSHLLTDDICWTTCYRISCITHRLICRHSSSYAVFHMLALVPRAVLPQIRNSSCLRLRTMG